MGRSEIYGKHWDDKEFVDTFITFKNFTLVAEKEFAHLCSEIIVGPVPKPTVSILDIGTGNGVVSKYFIEKMLSLTSIASYIGIDIANHLTELTRTELLEHSHTFSLTLQTADALTYEPPSKQDIIVAFNSWYGIPFDQIKVFRSHLTEGGVLAILLNSEQNLTIDIADKFKQEESVISSEMLMDWLTKAAIPFSAHFVTSQLFSSANFLNENGIVPEALDFLRYILRNDVSKISEITEYLKTKPEQYFKLPQHLVLIKN